MEKQGKKKLLYNLFSKQIQSNKNKRKEKGKLMYRFQENKLFSELVLSKSFLLQQEFALWGPHCSAANGVGTTIWREQHLKHKNIKEIRKETILY